MPIRRKPKGRPKRKPGQYTTMPVKGLKPVKGKPVKRRKPMPSRKRKFITLPIKKEFV